MDDDARLDWLRGLSEASGGGYNALGWPATMWVLHTIWESNRLDVALKEPLVFGGLTFTPTGELGWTEPDGDDWHRVSWQELYVRAGRLWPGQHDFPPGFEWLGDVRGVELLGPAEGSLDSHTLPALMRHLVPRAGEFTAHWAGGATQWMGPVVITGDPASLRLRHYPVSPWQAQEPLEVGQSFTPTNMWPTNREWFTFTDYDLQATKVSGPVDLIQALVDDPDLETNARRSIRH